MKKLLIALVILFALLSLAGCKGTESPENKTTFASSASAAETTTSAETTTILEPITNILNQNRIGRYYYSETANTISITTQYQFEIDYRLNTIAIKIMNSTAEVQNKGVYIVESGNFRSISGSDLLLLTANFDSNLSIVDIVSDTYIRILTNDSNQNYFWLDVHLWNAEYQFHAMASISDLGGTLQRFWLYDGSDISHMGDILN